MSRKSRWRKTDPVVETSVSWEKVGIYTRASVSDGGSISESIRNQETYIKKIYFGKGGFCLCQNLCG